MRYEARAPLAQNAMAARLLELMARKKTNLSVAADVPTADAMLALADAVGPHVCVLKTHVDVFDAWTPEHAARLQELAEKHGGWRWVVVGRFGGWVVGGSCLSGLVIGWVWLGAGFNSRARARTRARNKKRIALKKSGPRRAAVVRGAPYAGGFLTLCEMDDAGGPKPISTGRGPSPPAPSGCGPTPLQSLSISLSCART